jgi:hypothetical protein
VDVVFVGYELVPVDLLELVVVSIELVDLYHVAIVEILG